MPLVTAVITTHKRQADIVERALNSILSQTHKNLEVFVVDDSPADFSERDKVKAIIESYSERNVKYIQHEKCMGACAARNTGLAASNGEYIAFLDDDDVWKPDKIDKQLLCFDNKKVGLVYCGAEVVDLDSNSSKERSVKFVRGNVFDELMYGNFIGSTSFPLIRTECLKSIGGFDPLMQSAQDFDVWLRIAKNHDVNFTNDILVTYYTHAGDQISKSSLRRINGQTRIIEKNIDYLKKHKDSYRIRLFKLANEYAKNKQYFAAMRRYLKAAFFNLGKLSENLTYLYALHISFLRSKKNTSQTMPISKHSFKNKTLKK